MITMYSQFKENYVYVVKNKDSRKDYFIYITQCDEFFRARNIIDDGLAWNSSPSGAFSEQWDMYEVCKYTSKEDFMTNYPEEFI